MHEVYTVRTLSQFISCSQESMVHIPTVPSDWIINKEAAISKCKLNLYCTQFTKNSITVIITKQQIYKMYLRHFLCH